MATVNSFYTNSDGTRGDFKLPVTDKQKRFIESHNLQFTVANSGKFEILNMTQEPNDLKMFQKRIWCQVAIPNGEQMERVVDIALNKVRKALKGV